MLEKSKRAFKQFISSRWCPLAVAGVALLAVLVIAFLLGFRVTYAPELENSWEAISAVASWTGACPNFTAVWVAVQIPRKIAEQQERVELYERRLNFYYTICDCVCFADNIKKLSSKLKIEYMFLLTFGHERVPEKTETYISETVNSILHRVITTLQSGEFLFDFEVIEYVKEITLPMIELMTIDEVENVDIQIKKYCTSYQNASIKLYENLIPLVKDTLRLTKA